MHPQSKIEESNIPNRNPHQYEQKNKKHEQILSKKQEKNQKKRRRPEHGI
uniref:Uncharacterized protein n=1 Tax=Rhizophora mucronata TaxID=61149 RepID=A0A2P2L1I8_RHIMU